MAKRHKVDHGDILGSLAHEEEKDEFGKMAEEVLANQEHPGKVESSTSSEEGKEVIGKVGEEKNVTGKTEEGVGSKETLKVLKNEKGDGNEGGGKSGLRKGTEEDAGSEVTFSGDELYSKPPMEKLVPEGGYQNLQDIAGLIYDSLMSNKSTQPDTIHFDSSSAAMLDKIVEALGYDKNIGKKAKKPLAVRIVFKFFWMHFGEDIKRRAERGKKRASKMPDDL